MTDQQTDSTRIHQGLYEVHLPVTDIRRSMDFYTGKLGFELGFGDPEEGSVLLIYVRGNTRWMLGLFEVEEIEHRHPAEYHISFRISSDEVDRMIPHLEQQGIEPVHPSTAPREGPMQEPIVHGWMPAAAVFFRDPDGHLLELIAELPDEPRPDFVYRPLSEWKDLGPSS